MPEKRWRELISAIVDNHIDDLKMNREKSLPKEYLQQMMTILAIQRNPRLRRYWQCKQKQMISDSGNVGNKMRLLFIGFELIGSKIWKPKTNLIAIRRYKVWTDASSIEWFTPLSKITASLISFLVFYFILCTNTKSFFIKIKELGSFCNIKNELLLSKNFFF